MRAPRDADPMTVAEAAAALGLAASSVRRQIELGRMAARKFGPVWTVERREVERYRAESLGRPGRRS